MNDELMALLRAMVKNGETTADSIRHLAEGILQLSYRVEELERKINSTR